MAILQRVALYPNERLDIPDARSLEGFSLNDWRFFIKGVMAGQSYVVQGFEVSNYANIFLVPGFKIRLSTVALLHPSATTQAAGFYVTNGQEADAVVTLSASAMNYVEADLSTASGTPDVRAFWDPGANSGEGGEYTDTVDTVINLQLNVTSNVSGFTSGKIPLYKVITNSSGVVTSLTDCRPMFFRLGTGGNTPDPFASYGWPNLPDSSKARQEGAVTVTTATINNAPFQGGDKNIKTLKEWMDAVMTVVREIKGTPYWYTGTASGGGSPLINSYQNSALTILLGGTMRQLGATRIVKARTATTLTVDAGSSFNLGPDSFVHGVTTYTYNSYSSLTGQFTGVSPNPVGSITVGDAIRQGPYGHLQLADGTTLYRMGKTYNNSVISFSDVDMSALDSRVLYVVMPAGDENAVHGFGDDGATPVSPKLVTTFSSVDITVATGGNYATGGGKIMVRGTEFTYTSYVSATGLFTGVSPDPTGIVQVNDTAYAAPSSGVGYLHLSSREQVPGQTGSISEGAERVFWLAVYDGVSTIRTHDGAMQPGEAVQIGNNDTTNIIQYIGSTGPSDNFPVYNVNSIPNGTDLTSAIKTAFQIIETPIYDETVTVPINDVSLYWPATAPVDGPTIDASTKAFSQGFTPTASLPLTHIRFKGREIGAPDCYYVCEIRNDVGGLPGATVYATSGLFQAGTLGAAFGEVSFYFDTPHTVSSGTVYHAVVKVYGSPNTLNGSNYIIFGVNTSDPYSGGQAGDSTDSGVSFSANTWDLQFYAQDASGLAPGHISILPINSKTSQPASYTLSSDELVIYVDGVLMEPNQDYTELTVNSIQWIKPVVASGRIRFRVGNIGGAAGSSAALSLQGAYNNNPVVAITPGVPMTITGSSGKLLSIQGDLEVTGVIDPTGIELTPSSDPFAAGKAGIYYDPTEGLKIKKPDNTYLKAQDILEQVSGNAQNFQRLMQNSTGTTIAAKKAVYIASPGNIAPADASDATKSVFLGVTAASISTGSSGPVIYSGVVENFFGSPTSGYVWLDTLAGEVSTVAPTGAGEKLVIVGIADGLDLILQPQVIGEVAGIEGGGEGGGAAIPGLSATYISAAKYDGGSNYEWDISTINTDESLNFLLLTVGNGGGTIINYAVSEGITMKLVIDGSVVSTISSEQIHPWGMVIVPVSVYGALSEGPHSFSVLFQKAGYSDYSTESLAKTVTVIKPSS